MWFMWPDVFKGVFVADKKRLEKALRENLKKRKERARILQETQDLQEEDKQPPSS